MDQREHIDTSTAAGRGFLSIMGVISQMEQEIKAECAAAGRMADNPLPVHRLIIKNNHGFGLSTYFYLITKHTQLNIRLYYSLFLC